MLVLSRQRDETIMIGDDVEITVVDIRGDKVRLGITAPRQIQVHRKEVYDAIKRENQQAAKLSPRDVADVVERGAEESKPNGESRGAGNGKPDVESRDPDKNRPGKEPGERKEFDGPRRSDQAGRSA